MALPFYQIDAFSSRPFWGNPAAVCPLMNWLPEEVLQAIASENNLSETAFIVPGDSMGHYHLRWFTPKAEVDLCGHATLATAHVLLSELSISTDILTFSTKSGPLTVKRDATGYVMDFPAVPAEPCKQEVDVKRLIGIDGEVVGKAMDLMVRVDSEEAVESLSPNLPAIAALDARGLIVTAKSSEEGVDFVSRFFAPQVNVPEDPVTGSAHCTMAPYWAKELGKSSFFARQIGPRGGELRIRLEGDRVYLTGEAVTVITGEMKLPM